MAHAFLKAATHSPATFCGKACYLSAKDARKALSKMGASRRNSVHVAMGTGAMVAYKCRICGEYHLGHQRRHEQIY